MRKTTYEEVIIIKEVSLEVSVRQERYFYCINHFTYFMQYDFG